MRIPVFFVIPLCLAVIAGVWWQGTRHYDFLAPPSEAKLNEIRMRSVAPTPQAPAEPVRGPDLPVVARGREAAPSAKVEIDPEVDVGDLSLAPHLDLYADRAGQGAAHFLALASLLETKGEFQRALLAWERVLDRAEPDFEQTKAAVAAIRRLRSRLPQWNTDDAARKVVVLKIGTVKSKVAALKPVADETARILEEGSSGILRCKVIIEAVKDPKSTTSPAPPAPTAVWLSGDGAKAPTSEQGAFTNDKPDQLGRDLRKALFQVLRVECAKTKNLMPPPVTNETMGAADALRWAITRAEWTALAKRFEVTTPAVPDTPKPSNKNRGAAPAKPAKPASQKPEPSSQPAKPQRSNR